MITATRLPTYKATPQYLPPSSLVQLYSECRYRAIRDVPLELSRPAAWLIAAAQRHTNVERFGSAFEDGRASGESQGNRRCD